MYLKSDEIKKREGLIVDFNEDLVGPISYDLTISKIISENIEKKEVSLEPNEIAFIACEQILNLPNDLLGVVHGKNSRIRQGVDIVSPIYQPGHKTRIFFRIQNVSSDIIHLKEKNKIAQISFAELKGSPSVKYEGEFLEEFDYKSLGKYTVEYKTEKFKKEIEKFENLQNKIYLGVASIFGVLISLFSFLNAGFKIQNNSAVSISELFTSISLCMVILITFLFGIIGLLFSKRIWTSIILIFTGFSAFIFLYFIDFVK